MASLLPFLALSTVGETGESSSSSFQEHIARIVALHPTDDDESADLFLPRNFIWNEVVPWIFGVTVLVTLFYYAAYIFFMDRILLAAATTTTQPTTNSSATPQTSSVPTQPHERSNGAAVRSSTTATLSTAQKRKLCYQFTNLVINLCLGVAGAVYFERLEGNILWASQSNNWPTTMTTSRTIITVQETIAGYDHVVYFSAAQIGYQLWSLYMGVRHIVPREPLHMLLHHVTVVVCASMSGFLRCGFRYYTPFFYGLVELSSVPLAVMNAFKDHPVLLIEPYPHFYKNVRLAFAFTFLYIRVVLFVPRQYTFLRDHYLLWSSFPDRRRRPMTRPIYQAYMAVVWLSSFFLLLLQLYWAYLILKGLLFGNTKSAGTTRTTRTTATSATDATTATATLSDKDKQNSTSLRQKQA
jgi:TLC domain